MKGSSLLTDEIILLCKDLSLTEEEEEDAVTIDGNMMKQGEEKLKLCLMGRFVANKTINSEAFRNTMPKIWRTNQEVQIVDMNRNTFAFYFKCKSDMQRIKVGGPWHFDNFVLVLEQPSRFGDQAQMQFNKVEFCVQISNIPLCCMICEMCFFIGEQVGKVLEIDEEDYHNREGGCIRARVRIDMRKPLKRFLKLDLTREGETRILMVRYKRLPDFCYQCGMLGHGERDCAINPTTNVKQLKPYGTWLRVASPQEKVGIRGKQEYAKEKGKEPENFRDGGRPGKSERKDQVVRSLPPVPMKKLTQNGEGSSEVEGTKSQREVCTKKEGTKRADKGQKILITDEEVIQSIADMSTAILKLQNRPAELRMSVLQKSVSSNKEGQGEEKGILSTIDMEIDKTMSPSPSQTLTPPDEVPEKQDELTKELQNGNKQQSKKEQTERDKVEMGLEDWPNTNTSGLGQSTTRAYSSTKWKNWQEEPSQQGWGLTELKEGKSGNMKTQNMKENQLRKSKNKSL